MDFSFIIGISAFVGPILSWFYEKVFGTLRGNWKYWVFALVCIIMGGGLALANGEIVFEKLVWNDLGSIFTSLGMILKWAGSILVAGETYFFVVAKKKKPMTPEELNSMRLLGTKETSVRSK